MADNNIDLLDLNDDLPLPDLDGSDPFASESKSKNIWKLALIGGLALVAAGYVVYKLAGKTAAPRDEIAAIVLENTDAPIVEDAAEPAAVQPDPDGLNQRVVEDRKDVKFDPAAGNVNVTRPRPLPAAGTPARATNPAPRPAAQGKWSAQVGSLSTRAAAEREQKNLTNNHRELFSNRAVTVVPATLPGGNQTFRLRVSGFSTGGDANAFCQRAKTRGINCYAVPTGK
ncbi:MAG: SPOR domain-containing protein [Alphaproteobacteria bacterium]|nr:SPOR domain-containing protein [Alphaproteobacteria bacterium]